MRRHKLFWVGLAAIGLLFLGAGAARAADVTISVPTTFAVADASDGTVDGVFNVTGNLLITSTGSITCNDDPPLADTASACPITIVVTGRLLMEAGSEITADNNFDGGNAGDITITVGTDMTMCGPNGGQPGCAATGIPGALISAQKKSGGATSVVNSVTITVGDKATATGTFYMEGGVTTYGHETGATIDTTSTTGHAGNIDITAGKTYFTEPGSVVQAGDPLGAVTATAQGGKIFLVADCGLTSQGRVTSKGPDFGADLVHLESCTVLIEGLVESTGKGHVADAPNSCDLINDGLPGEVLRDHPAESTGCVEVWGNFIKIDSFTINPATGLPWAGELNSDIGDGGPQGTSWIDIFAFSDLTVIDGTGNDFVRNNLSGHLYWSTYAVHANAMDGSDLNPSVITAKVKNGPLTASGKAFEASSTLTAATGHAPGPFFTGNGSHGGTIDLEASGTVTLDTAWVNASGDFDQAGAGGHILVSAWGAGSDVLWRNGVGDVRPIASGTIDLNACDLIDITGTEFYLEVPTQTHVCNASKPDIPVITPANAGPVFKQDLWALCGGGSTISGRKFDDVTLLGLGGWTIHIFNADKSVHFTFVTLADGSYTFTGLPADTYTICEQLLSTSWTQSFPAAGVNCLTTVDTPVDNPLPGPIGYSVELTAGTGCGGSQQITGKDFGNHTTGSKSGKKFNDADNSGSFTAGDTPIAGWPINLLTTANVLITTVNTGAGGTYSFPNLAPGTYRVCEGPPPVGFAGFVETFPHGPLTGLPANDFVINTCPAPNIWGYQFIITGTENFTDDDFGNKGGCLKQTVLDVMAATYPGNSGPDTTVHTDAGGVVQTAVDNASDTNLDGYIIVMVIAKADGSLGGSANQKVVVSKDYTLVPATNLPFGLFGCSVTLTGGGSDPAVWVKDTAKGKSITINGRPTTIFVMDLHGGNSTVGVEADGTNRYLRNEGAGNNGTGIKVLGSYNTVHNGSAGSNTGVGLKIIGSFNYVTDTDTFGNSSHGVEVTGDRNQLLKIDTGDKGKGNGGDGLKVTGNSNIIQEVDAYANTLNAFEVTGTGNSLSKNRAGDRGDKANGGAGFLLSGGSSLVQNTAIANKGNGFKLLTSGFSLKNNVSGGTGTGYPNGVCQYNFLVAGNTNAGGNKSNGVTLVGSPFPAGCK